MQILVSDIWYLSQRPVLKRKLCDMPKFIRHLLSCIEGILLWWPIICFLWFNRAMIGLENADNYYLLHLLHWFSHFKIFDNTLEMNLWLARVWQANQCLNLLYYWITLCFRRSCFCCSQIWRTRHRHIEIFTRSNLMDSKGWQPFR